MVNSECLKRKTLTSGTTDDILISADINSENRHRKINKKGVTVIKRPVFWILLAFVLGEVIAVFDLNIAVPCIVLAIIVIRKIIIKACEDMGAFVVIFFTLITGFMLMSNEITTRNHIYDLKENTVIVQGKIYKIEN